MIRFTIWYVVITIYTITLHGLLSPDKYLNMGKPTTNKVYVTELPWPSYQLVVQNAEVLTVPCRFDA